MSLVRWQPGFGVRRFTPHHELADMHSDMGRLFNWAFGGRGDVSALTSDWMPAIDVYEDDNAYHVRADLPGLKRDEIDITLDNNTLSISGEKKDGNETKSENVYRAERYYGKFLRSVELPSVVNTEKIEAQYKDGVLEIVVPKSEEARPKQIKIES